MRVLLAAAAALTLCAAGGAMAAAQSGTQLIVGGEASGLGDSATLTQDTKTVDAILAAMQTGGYDVVATHRAELEAVLAHAPVPFSQVEERDGVANVRATSLENCLMSMMEYQAALKKQAKGSIRCVGNPYPLAALALGSWLNDGRHFSEALAMLDRGLAYGPQLPGLLSEKGVALGALHRPGEALAAYKAGAESPLLNDRQRGIILRGEGYALVDLNRLDEAEAAYKESLKVDPDHGHAVKELQYIESVRRGAPNSGPMQITSELPGATNPH